MTTLTLHHPLANGKKTFQLRRGFSKKPKFIHPFECNLPSLSVQPCIVYGMSKISHSGVSCWKTFEGFNRKMAKSSLKNLLNQLQSDYGTVDSKQQIANTRKLNSKQTRQIKNYANKLCYYSHIRTFQSKKSGKYQFKVAFVTLTAPSTASNNQLIKAFEAFLEWIRRTCNCTYVWKKELGEIGGHLHFHLLINNFIPYYLISWKWRKLLIFQNVKWTTNESGKDTNSHSRIELPKSRRLVAHYIAKYMSKAYELPKELGYISGHSEVLETCKEMKFIENDLPKDEVLELMKHYRTIRDQFITHICVDLRYIQTIAPTIYYYFMQQFKSFQESICLPQKYWYV